MSSSIQPVASQPGFRKPALNRLSLYQAGDLVRHLLVLEPAIKLISISMLPLYTRAIAFSSIRKAIGSAACCCHEPKEPPDPRTVTTSEAKWSQPLASNLLRNGSLDRENAIALRCIRISWTNSAFSAWLSSLPARVGGSHPSIGNSGFHRPLLQ